MRIAQVIRKRVAGSIEDLPATLHLGDGLIALNARSAFNLVNGLHVQIDGMFPYRLHLIASRTRGHACFSPALGKFLICLAGDFFGGVSDFSAAVGFGAFFRVFSSQSTQTGTPETKSIVSAPQR